MVGLAYAIGLLIQGVVVVRAQRAAGSVRAEDVADLLRLAGGRVFAAPAFGEEAAHSLWRDHGSRFLLLATSMVAVALVSVGIGADRRGRIVGAVLAGHALALFAVITLSRGTDAFRLTGSLEVFAQVRYLYVPDVLLFGSVAAMAASRRRPAGVVSRLLPLFLVAHTVLLVVTSFTVTGVQGSARTWQEGLEIAREECAPYSQHPDREVSVVQDRFGLFAARLRCGDLGR